MEKLDRIKELIIKEVKSLSEMYEDSVFDLTEFNETVNKIDNLDKIILYSDSMYTINCATKWAIEWEKNGWKRKTGDILNLIYVKERSKG